MEPCTTPSGCQRLPIPAQARAGHPTPSSTQPRPHPLQAENNPVVARLLSVTRRQWGLELDLQALLSRKGRRVVLYV